MFEALQAVCFRSLWAQQSGLFHDDTLFVALNLFCARSLNSQQKQRNTAKSSHLLNQQAKDMMQLQIGFNMHQWLLYP